MASGRKSRRTPQTWASCQKKASKSDKWCSIPMGSRSEDLGDVVADTKRTGHSSEAALTRTQDAQIRPPPCDASDEVLEEYMTSVRRKNATVTPVSTASDHPPLTNQK
ncbi:hypothetical protein KC19_VG178400 [Ceratodon purpureus]|uniref:Uncharacterized protein n=1 Tax=Ceratodon purpureus TaxID=3225 RepID=A0A8T0HRM0_CERPU|nr:hypothetical protein KC19_VG178400 [Ceratodon purpureus]